MINSERTIRIEKYFSALKNLKLILENTPSLSMQRFIANNSLNNKFGKVLLDNKILKKTGSKVGVGSEYEWSGIEPNLKMAEKLVDEIAIIARQYVLQAEDKQKISKTKINIKDSTRKLSHYELRLLFGLVKLKLTPKFN